MLRGTCLPQRLFRLHRRASTAQEIPPPLRSGAVRSFSQTHGRSIRVKKQFSTTRTTMSSQLPDRVVSLTNRCGESKSPYVRSHLNNPTAWQLWSPETLELARKTNRLLFVSIGYSACHWVSDGTVQCLDASEWDVWSGGPQLTMALCQSKGERHVLRLVDSTPTRQEHVSRRSSMS